MRKKMVLLLMLLSIGLWPSAGLAETSIMSSDGVKAILKTDPAKKMVDLFLSEQTTGKEITEAVVKASVTLPDGTKIQKDLIGMKMGEAYSFMNSLDMSRPGRYSFVIFIKSSGKSIKFEFTQNIH